MREKVKNEWFVSFLQQKECTLQQSIRNVFASRFVNRAKALYVVNAALSSVH